jgi:hypothetical protein
MATVDVRLRVVAIRWVSNDFPGWMEVSALDVRGQEHRIVEKVPILSRHTITDQSPFPFELWIAGEMDGIDGDQVTVTFSEGVETTDGARRITVSTSDVIWP